MRSILGARARAVRAHLRQVGAARGAAAGQRFGLSDFNLLFGHTQSLQGIPHRQRTLPGQGGIFAYASLIWRPEFEFAEERSATLPGYHRALKMWSSLNRGTPECPGLVFGLLPGGSCKGVAFRLPQARVAAALPALWAREMPNGVYDPKWLRCQSLQGDVRALAFTLSKRSPSHTGVLTEDRYRQIFSSACGRYGSTRDYAQRTYDKLRTLGIHDHALGKLLELVKL